MTILFVERLRILHYMALLVTNQRAFYLRESLALRVLRRFLRRGGANIKQISYGDLSQTSGIRKRAYEKGKEVLAAYDIAKWHRKLKVAASVDDRLLSEKFLFDRLVAKYEFHLLALRYAEENPNVPPKIIVEADFEPLNEISQGDVPVSVRRNRLAAAFYCVGLCSAYLALNLAAAAVKRRRASVDGVAICEVDDIKIYEMFSDLLCAESMGLRGGLRYYIQPQYVAGFGKKALREKGVETHTLCRGGALVVARTSLAFVRGIFSDLKFFQKCGDLPFEYLSTIAAGVRITPGCRNSAFFTFEHLTVARAVRNELLRAQGCCSIFVPYNSYAIGHYYAPEYRYNYDALCSPSRLLETIYGMQSAVTSVYIPTGAYAPNKSSAGDDPNKERRKEALRRFRHAEHTVITILSPGIQDRTLSIELRLMALSRALAQIPGVLVMVRPKPVVPPVEFRDFYREKTKGEFSIVLTDSSFKLTDFLAVTDLFITSVSSSAVDMCGAGGQFYCVDFWNDKDDFLWQTVVPGVLLEPDEAEATISGWIDGDASGTRAAHKGRMDALRALIGYDFPNFNAYRDNFRRRVHSYVRQIFGRVDLGEDGLAHMQQTRME